ncbi:MAG: hypothetical protein KGL39_10705 [Patescibacteria group bacterium]|nr:hypothetical protein [Patescibacteria group bacterium]
MSTPSESEQIQEIMRRWRPVEICHRAAMDRMVLAVDLEFYNHLMRDLREQVLRDLLPLLRQGCPVTVYCKESAPTPLDDGGGYRRLEVHATVTPVALTAPGQQEMRKAALDEGAVQERKRLLALIEEADDGAGPETRGRLEWLREMLGEKAESRPTGNTFALERMRTGHSALIRADVARLFRSAIDNANLPGTLLANVGEDIEPGQKVCIDARGMLRALDQGKPSA